MLGPIETLVSQDRWHFVRHNVRYTNLALTYVIVQQFIVQMISQRISVKSSARLIQIPLHPLQRRIARDERNVLATF